MPMKRILAITILLAAITQAEAQSFVTNVLKRISLEGFGGLANYQGELQESRYTFSQARPALALGASLAITDKLSLRGLGTFASVKGADSYSTNEAKRLRNLSFQSRIYDASATIVYEFFDMGEKRYTPYVFAGGSVFYFNPTARDSVGQLIYLIGNRTEGQGLPQYPDRKVYSLIQFSIPFGGGIKYAVNDKVSLGWEFRFNKTFTDYIDDVSTTYVSYNVLLAARGPKAVEMAYRGGELKDGNPNYPANGTQRGNPKTKDWYYFSGITLSYRLFARESSSHGSRGGSIACPRNVY